MSSTQEEPTEPIIPSEGTHGACHPLIRSPRSLASLRRSQRSLSPHRCRSPSLSSPQEEPTEPVILSGGALGACHSLRRCPRSLPSLRRCLWSLSSLRRSQRSLSPLRCSYLSLSSSQEEPMEPVITQKEPTEPVVTQEEPTEPVVTHEEPMEPVVPHEEPTEPTVPKAAPTPVSPYLIPCLVPALFVLLLLILCIWCCKQDPQLGDRICPTVIVSGYLDRGQQDTLGDFAHSCTQGPLMCC
ncbi:uncharacterized protein [Manis javanica]|uniref:uncharacterized protein n=1 Tax=Manis javanica TaxID=9974 RepID=UPI003C6CD85B